MRVRIISLGEIVTQNIMKAIEAFTTLIASKRASSDPLEVGRAIGGVLQANMNLINDFKLGKISESDFNEKMIIALEKATNVKLVTDEFNTSWNTMNPAYAHFQGLLNEAIAFHSQSGQKIIFISFTNPKDIRHLIEQLRANGVAYKVNGEQLTEIAGIKLFTTYTAQKTKAELIVAAINELQSNSEQTVLAASMGAIFNTNQHKPLEPKDIKYVRGVNDVKDPVLKDDLDKTIQEAEKTTSSLSIETIIWKKFEKQSLSEVLNNSTTASRALPSFLL